MLILARRGAQLMRRPVVERAESGKPEIWLSSFGADIGASRHRLVERREAPGPTSLGSRASKRRVWVTRLCRRRAAGRVMVRQGGFAHPLAPPGAPSPHSRDGKKGQGVPGVLRKSKPRGSRALATRISGGPPGYYRLLRSFLAGRSGARARIPSDLIHTWWRFGVLCFAPHAA
jgi:hypothetical protein